ncbi:MAG: PKD domain-containing protein [Saprospiraceae bacterium]|nr:PKD domain-containing protein [Saprospiraceae bacterium]
MKTFVLLFIFLHGWFLTSTDQQESKISNATNGCAYTENVLPAPSTFQLLAGDAQSNTFKKVLYHQNHYYVIGDHKGQASLCKFTETGTLVWTQVVNDTSSWNDFLVNSSGNLLLVGSRDINASLPKDVMVGTYDLNGNVLFLNSYDYGINESYNSIVTNPLHVTEDFRYMVVGSINRTNNRNDDDVIVTTMNPQGSSLFGWRKRIGSLNIDDEFHSKITVYDPVAGTFALSGRLANNGTYVVINGAGMPTNQGRGFGVNVLIHDVQRTSSGEHLVAGTFVGFPPKGRIYKISPTTANNFMYESSIITNVHQIIPVQTNGFYAVGESYIAFTSKPVVFQGEDNGSSLIVHKGKYPLVGDNFGLGNLYRSGLNDFAYVDGRLNTPDGYGLQDGYLASHVSGIDDCGLDSVGGNFLKMTLSTVISQPTTSIETLREPASLTSSPIQYRSKEICNFECIGEISATQTDQCGNVQFNITTNLPGILSYCWDFGDIPPCGSTQPNPSHNYNAAGTYQVCLTVSNGTNECEFCKNVTVTQADHNPPAIVCPPNITVDCDESILPAFTGSATATDIVDPNPVINYTDIIIQMTLCYKEIIRDWSATDFCGNVIHCQQTIVQADLNGPVISCPPPITVDCNAAITPNITGDPLVLEECNAYSQSYYDKETGGPCPKQIQRTWTVTDECGRSTQCLQFITVNDTELPTIVGCGRNDTLQGSISESGICEAAVTLTAPLASDNCDVTPVIVNNYNNTNDASGIYPVGTHYVIWTVTDACGNTATCQDTVNVLPCASCPDTCRTNVLNISTGFDPINDVLLFPGSATSAWQLTTTPLVVVPYTPSVPAPAYVISPNSAWANQLGSQWISAYPFPDLEADNPEPNPPYTLENCFCVCEDSTIVTIDMSILVDNTTIIDLCDASGTLIQNLASITSGTTADFTTPTVVAHTVILDAGKYCIKAKLRNESSVAMGLNILGSITGVGMMESVCCGQTNFITGHKYLDKKCNGRRDVGDPPGIGWEIQLKDGNGDLIQTSFTDAYGFYVFQNIPIGQYTVCEVQKPGYLQKYPLGGEHLVNVLDMHTPIVNLNFGNCPLDTCCVDEQAFIDVATTPVTVIRDSCMICINHPCIGWCQRLSIDWGDGNTTGYYEGIGAVDASHTYQQSGNYTICLKFEETDSNGLVCFKRDSCFSVCVQCGICEKTEIALNCFNMFGESKTPLDLPNHSDFYIDSDNQGNYYCTGHYNGGPVSGHLNDPAINNDCFVSKYDENCGLCWNFSISGDANDQGLVIKHFDGGFYVAGVSDSKIINIPGGGGTGAIHTNNYKGQVIFLAKYSIVDACDPYYVPTLKWSLIYGNDEYRTLLSDMDLDLNNNPILVGIFTDTLFFNDHLIIVPPLTLPTPYIVSGGNQDFYMVKFDNTTGEHIWSTSLVPSASNTGGAYPLGVSVGSSGEIYVAGHYSKLVDFGNNTSPDLPLGPNVSPRSSHYAPFVAKFTDPSNTLTFDWAFAILGPPPALMPYLTHGTATDIEAINGGFVISFDKNLPKFNDYELNPRGSSVLVDGPNETSFIVKYDSDGMYQCHKEIPNHNYINELSVDNADNIYFIGGNNYSASGITFVNTYFGVVDTDCNLKDFNLNGFKNDDGWSITPDNNGSFVIIGRTNSPDFKRDPYTAGSPIYSASGNDPDIFIGKYSCECIISPDTINCCDNISVTAEKYSDENLMCTDSSCCFSVDLNNDLVFGIKSAKVNLLTPGWSFGNVSVVSGLYVNGTTTHQFISNFGGIFPGNTLPAGYTNDFFNFCLVGQLGAASTQEIEFIWYEMTKSGSCIAVCRDTIKTDCLAPTCAPNCTEPVNMQIACDTSNPNQYCLSFNVTNLSPYPATGVSIGVVGTAFGLVPCGGTGYFDPLDIDFASALDPGNTSALICIKLISALPILSPQDVCLEFGLTYSDTSFCFQDTQYCYQIEPCCNPCEEIQIVAREIQVDSSSCCYALDLINNCAIDYFGKIEIESLTPGVSFGNLIKDSYWIYCTPPTPDLVCLDYPGAYLPSGTTTDLIQFCLDSATTFEDLGCWRMLAVGGQHTLAIRNDGTLWAWGDNFSGQLGDGTTIAKNVPIQVSGDTDWKFVSAGGHFSIALKDGGTLWAWGGNYQGQLGQGNYFNSSIPLQVGSDSDWDKVDAGGYMVLATKINGTLWAWGENQYGQLGDGTFINRTSPILISSGNWKTIDASMGHHCFAIDLVGNLWGWGKNDQYQLGDGSNINRNSLTLIDVSNNWKSIKGGWEHTTALKNDGSLWAWGRNQFGQLGNGNYATVSTPTMVGTEMQWEQISTGAHFSIATKQGGSLWLWGNNAYGQLGNGTTIHSNIPLQLIGAGNWHTVLAGYAHTLTYDYYDQLSIWGLNYWGGVGDGTNIDKLIPTNIPCPSLETLAERSQSTILSAASALSSMFKIRFYESDDQTVACDTMLQFECAPDTINRCLVVTNAYAECLKDSLGYKITFTIDNISSPGFDATDLIISSPDANVVSITPSSISLYPALGPADPPRMVMTFVVTSPFPDPDGIIHLQMQLSDATGNYYCNQVAELSIPLPSCNTECALCPEHSEQGPNLVTNGNFESGNVGFSSALAYHAFGTLTAGEYSIRNSLNLNNGQWSCIDHTFGSTTNLFFVADGPSTSDPIWSQSVNLQAGTTYVFCFWANNLVSRLNQMGAPMLLARLSGGPIIIPTTVINQSPDQWVLLTGTFTATVTGPVNIEIWDTQGSIWDDIAIDDISLVACTSTCVCDNLSDIQMYNSEFNTIVRCQGKPNPPVSYLIRCPKNETSFNIEGSLNCKDSCDGVLQWQIKNYLGTVVLFGTEFVDPVNPVWTINLLYSQFTQGENYFVHLNGICGTDTCKCDFQFYIQECDTCCKPKEVFEALVQNAIHITTDQALCKATLHFDELPCDIRIQSINWKDGTISTGPFYPGSMVMHTYSATQMSFLIAVTVVEYDENGNICNSVSLLLPVSLNCKNCCKTGFAAQIQWLIASSNCFQTQVDGCNVTLTASLGDCYFFESTPDWGEPPSPVIGTIPANGTWTHTYSPGTYTVCMTISEYPFGNPALEPCRSRKVCKTITVDCADSCSCDGFSDLSFYFDKNSKVKAECGDTLTLECPPDDCIWTFSGNLLCKNDCPESLVSWQLVNSYDPTDIVASGTSVAFPGFGIYIPPAIVTAGGEYDLILSGHCDSNVECPCRIHLIFPGCDEICPCDPDDLAEDVEKGISKIKKLDDCLICFSPLALTECDMVRWFVLPNLNTPFAVSVGNQLICHDFRFPGNYNVKMEVVRKNADGSVCAEYEKIVTVFVDCEFPGPERERSLCDAEQWEQWIHSDGSLINSRQITRGQAVLRGNLNYSEGILYTNPVCLDKGQTTIQIQLGLERGSSIKHGSRLVVAAVEDTSNWTKLPQNWIPLAKVSLSQLTSDKLQMELPLGANERKLQFLNCQKGEPKKIFLIVFVENDLIVDLGNANTEIQIERICLHTGQSIVSTGTQTDLKVNVFPNPTNESFTLQVDHKLSSDVVIDVFDQLGNQMERFTLPQNKTGIVFGETYRPALYFLRINYGENNTFIKITKISK